MDDNSILEVRNLSVAFDDLVIFKDLSLEVKRGDSTAIIGPNGSGKTVLFRALIGTVPYQGEIHWAPQVKLGYVPQRLDLDRNLSLTLGDFLSLKARIFKLPKNSVIDALNLVHLPKTKISSALSHLSAGELQRTLIALALMGSPNVLLFDEPTAGVDLPGEEQIYQTLHEIQDQEQLTLIFISHDLNLVYRYADKVICLSKALVCFGSPKETLTPKILDKLYGVRVYHHLHQYDQ